MQIDSQLRNNASSREHLDDLLHRLQPCLRGLPGFRTLSLFGSVAEGRADGYSDLDLIVTTDELPAARAALLGALEEHCRLIAEAQGEPLPLPVFERMQGFIQRELVKAASPPRDPVRSSRSPGNTPAD